MFRWATYPFLRITLFFVAGIIAASYVQDFPKAFILIALLVGFGLILCLRGSRTFHRFNYLVGFIGFALLFLMGFIRFYLSSSPASDDISKYQTISEYSATIIAELGQSEKTDKYNLKIDAVRNEKEWRVASGLVRLYVYKDSLYNSLKYGDRIIIAASPEVLQKPRNPHEFNYKKFLGQQHIYHQQFISRSKLKVYDNGPVNWFVDNSITIREHCSNIIKKRISGERERAVAMALILGQKSELDHETKGTYATSGAMHILAVSGLHVGIIYAILVFLLGRFYFLRKGSSLFTILSLVLLWTYAFVTGLSPSVLRATIMFSGIIIASGLNRQTNIFNTLGASAFLVLLVDPFTLFSVGFQLSYAAVFGIVYIQPRLYKQIKINNYFLDKIWALTAVSIAAQLATFPLALMYFHIFPNYFLLTNLIVIPGAFLILTLGLAMILLDLINPLSSLLGFVLEKLIYAVNHFVFWIDALPFSTSVFYFDSLRVLLTYAVIWIFFVFFRFGRLRYLFILTALVGVLGALSIERFNYNKHETQIVFYDIPGHSAVDWVSNGLVLSQMDSNLMEKEKVINYSIEPNRFYLGLDNNKQQKIDLSENELVEWQGKRILFMGNHAAYADSMIVDIDYLVIRNNVKIEINALLKHLAFKEVIIDSSNKKYQAKKQRKSFEQLNLPLHSVPHQGAFIIHL